MHGAVEERARACRRAEARFHSRAVHRARGCCTYCGDRLDSANIHKRLEWDHVIPIAKGGSTGEGNLVPSCGKCNRSKGSKLLMEWRLAKMKEEMIRNGNS